MINGISPANRNVILNQRPNNNQNNPKTKPTETTMNNPMSLEKTNDKSFLDKIKANKKLLIAGTVGLVAITGALIYGIKKGIIFKGKIKEKTNEILSESEKVKQRGEEILTESEKIKQQGEEIANRAQEQYKKVMAIIEEAREKGFSDVVDESGKVIRRFGSENSETTKKIMDELDGDKIVRRTEFDSDTLEIENIYKNFNIDSNGTKSYAEGYLYADGELDEFFKDYKSTADGAKSWAEKYIYYNNTLFSYTKDYKSAADGTLSRAERYSYSNGKLDEFTKDYKSTADGTVSFTEGYSYSNGGLDKFFKDSKLTADGTVSRAEGYSYSNGKLDEFFKDGKLTADRTKSFAEKFIRTKAGELVQIEPKIE